MNTWDEYKNCVHIFFNIVIVGLITSIYASRYWYADISQSTLSISTQLEKPFVYRQLVPVLIRAISVLIPRVDIVFVVVIAIIGVVFYLSIRNLYFYFYRYGEKEEIFLVAFVLIGLILFWNFRKPYDLMTAFLFTQALLYMAKEDHFKYIVLFPLICLNRETAFFLIIVWGVVTVLRLEMGKRYIFLVYQVVMYVIIMVWLRVIFASNSGVQVLIEPLHNLVRFSNNPMLTIAHISLALLALRIIVQDWIYKPLFLRLSFCILFPILCVMYLIFGQAFEIRVFWEVYSVMVVLMVPTVVKFIENHAEVLFLQSPK